MNKYGGDDTIYMVGDVFKNKLNIQSSEQLEIAERELSAFRAESLLLQPLPKQFDLSYLQFIHQTLFGDVYDWAGEIRRIDISKGHTRFANFTFIESESQKLLDKLNRENNLQNLDKQAFSERAAYYLGELNVLHPFRDGNGRTLRFFITQLARKNGWQIRWQHISHNEMVNACIEAYHGNSNNLAILIFKHLDNW